VSSPSAWLTPDEIPAGFYCRELEIPANIFIQAAVAGALLPLTYPENWELFGTVTPEEIALAMSVMYEKFSDLPGACMQSLLPPVILTEEQSQNTNGGTFTSAAWRTRVLNTKRADVDGIIALSNNQFTLPIGRWLVKWRAPVNSVSRHQTLLYDVTADVGMQFGTSSFASGSGDFSHGELVFDVAVAHAFEIRHRCQTSVSSTGLGVASNFGTEVYTTVELYQIVG
jgi:hypothetical protein